MRKVSLKCGSGEDVKQPWNRGVRSNTLKLVVQANSEEKGKFDVMTYLNTTLCDVQTVAGAAELKDYDFVTFKKDGELEINTDYTQKQLSDGIEASKLSFTRRGTTSGF